MCTDRIQQIQHMHVGNNQGMSHHLNSIGQSFLGYESYLVIITEPIQTSNNTPYLSHKCTPMNK